jgi:glucokinase
METCLITDIGGTNSRFFLYKVDMNNPSKREKIHEQNYNTASYTNIYQILDSFLGHPISQENSPKFAVMAIAGAPVDNKIQMIANIGWVNVDGDEISAKYKMAFCKLLNDFEAVAYAFFTFGVSDLPLSKKSNSPDPAIRDRDDLIVMGYGTGLGTVLVRNFTRKDRYTVVPQEGGHLGFGPKTDEHWEVMKYVRKSCQVEENKILSQELFCCGIGIFAVYGFFYQLIFGIEFKGKLTSKEVFSELKKPENEKLKDKFFDFYLGVIATSWEQMARTFLSNGGHFLVGGTVSIILKEFFDSDVSAFLSKIQESLGGKEYFDDTFDHIHIHFYENDTQVFAIEGCLNYSVINSRVDRPKRFKKLSVESKPVDLKPVEPFDSGFEKKTILKQIKTPTEQTYLGNVIKDFYWSNLLHANVMTITGYLKLKLVGTNLMIAKVLSDPEFGYFSVDKECHRFQVYQVRFLDTVCKLCISTKMTRLLINDIVILNDKDKLFYTKKEGWYFQSYDNVISDISVVFFDNMISKWMSKTEVNLENEPWKVKEEFEPLPPLTPRTEFQPDSLLLFQPNLIKSFNILMKVLQVFPSVFVRETHDVIEELIPCQVQSQEYTYRIHIPKWSGVPTVPFYGYFVKRQTILPGYTTENILVVDDYTIISLSEEYEHLFPYPPLIPLRIDMIKGKQKFKN